MRSLTLGAIALGLCGLAACNNSTPQENAAANYEDSIYNQADQLDDLAGNTTNDIVADNLSNTADMMRENADNTADAIENGTMAPPDEPNGM